MPSSFRPIHPMSRCLAHQPTCVGLLYGHSVLVLSSHPTSSPQTLRVLVTFDPLISHRLSAVDKSPPHPSLTPASRNLLASDRTASHSPFRYSYQHSRHCSHGISLPLHHSRHALHSQCAPLPPLGPTSLGPWLRSRAVVHRIYGATHLSQLAATRSSSDGCLQAYRLGVLGSSLPSSLRTPPGPYPMVWAVSLSTRGTSLPQSNWPRTFLRHVLRSLTYTRTLSHAVCRPVLYLMTAVAALLKQLSRRTSYH